MPVKTQMAIVREIQGIAGRLDETTERRRKQSWKEWAIGTNNNAVREYLVKDIRIIVFNYWEDIFGCQSSEDDDAAGEDLGPQTAEDMSRRELISISIDLRTMLQMSNQYPSRSSRSREAAGGPNAATPKRWNDDGSSSGTGNSGAEGSSGCSKKKCISWPNLNDMIEGGMPKSFRLPDLRAKVKEGGFTAALDVARYEYALRHCRDKFGEVINAEIKAQDAKILPRDDIDWLKRMDPRAAFRMLQNVQSLLEEISPNGYVPGLFAPKEGQSLLSWIDDGNRYAGGERLPSQLTVDTKDGQMISDKAVHCMRHLIFTYDLSMGRFFRSRYCITMKFECHKFFIFCAVKVYKDMC